MTSERQVAAQRHMMDGNTEEEQLEHLKPVVEDWHCLVAFIAVSRDKWCTAVDKNNGVHHFGNLSSSSQ